MEFVETKTVKQLFKDLYNLEEKINRLINSNYSSCIQKMEETNDMNIRRGLFESFIRENILQDPKSSVERLRVAYDWGKSENDPSKEEFEVQYDINSDRCYWFVDYKKMTIDDNPMKGMKW